MAAMSSDGVREDKAAEPARDNDTIADPPRDADTIADPSVTIDSTPGGAEASGLRPGEQLGRYVLERVLGIGGMGVVHAAFDQDLERRVALKVLHATRTGDEARQRLLREARALARLSHPNVVAVYEVGSASGRDFIAMELVAGESLLEWLRAQRRARRDIIAAFLAAGRGLAAAHAAGLVHRDFKPHNVLRRPNGSIVVTDFGLARGDGEAVEPDITQLERPQVRADAMMDETVSVGVPVRRSSLSGLTVSGAVLGTPAYMSPEQWTGGEVGPAADQFSFCVALWEALAGGRPFAVDNYEVLRASMQRGPLEGDASILPRALRSILRRGLGAEPSARWPSMDALLAAIVRSERLPRLVATGAAATALAAIGFFAMPGASPKAASCEPPALRTVWSADQRATLERAGQRPAAAAIERDVQRWQSARTRACAADRSVRAARVACLDGVHARIDVYARAVAKLVGAPPVEDHGVLLDPELCEQERPPRLAATSTPERVNAIEAMLRVALAEAPLDEPAAEQLLAAVARDPCAAASARLLAAQARVSSAARDTDREIAARLAVDCGDDVVRAETALGRFAAALAEAPADARMPDRADVEKLVEAARAPDLVAMLRQLQARAAMRAGDHDTAIKLATEAATLHDQRGRVEATIDASLDGLAYRESRGGVDDLAAGPRLLSAWRERAVRELGATAPIVRRIDIEDARWLFWTGAAADAHARLEKLVVARPNRPAMRVAGRVVDGAGAPIAGAQVAAAPGAWGTSWTAVVASPQRRIAVSAADGTFAIPDAAIGSIVVASHGALRSPGVSAANPVTLQLSPTSRIEGQVELHGSPPQVLSVWLHDNATYTSTTYKLFAPVDLSGTFAIEGVPRGEVAIQVTRREWDPHRGAQTSMKLVVDAPVVRGVKLVAPAPGRLVYVVLRSTVAVPIHAAQAGIIPGQFASGPMNDFIVSFKLRDRVSFGFARPFEPKREPPAVTRVAKPGDLIVTLASAPEGEASACALSLPPGLSGAEYWDVILSHRDRLFVTCVAVPADAEAIVVDVPPPPRID